MKIVFLGSADFGIQALEQLRKVHSIVGVVSTPAKPQGRGLTLRDSPVAAYAREKGLAPIFTPQSLYDPDLVAALTGLCADIFIVVAFRILPEAIFSIPPMGTVNIHASLLPKFRGPAPIHRAIEAGETETGVTIFTIDAGVDTGRILLQKRVAIGPAETTPELYARLSTLGADGLMESLEELAAGRKETIPQDNALASRAPKLKKEEALIDWSRPASAIYNKIRAFKPFPGTYTMLDGRRLGIERGVAVDDRAAGTEGTIARVTEDFFDVNCSTGALRVLEVKPEGRRSMSVHDFLLGTELKGGMHLAWMPVR
jgi:methionyl-tRNA formyltransferase